MARTLIGNFKGPKGDKGEQGATGPKGEQGIQGPEGPAGGVNSVNGGQGDVVVGGGNLLPIASLIDGKPYKIQFTSIDSPHSSSKVGYITTPGQEQQIVQTAELPWLEPDVTYTASFTAWTDAGEQTFALDYFPDTLPGQIGFIATTIPQRFAWTMKTNLAEIVNACFRVIIVNGVTAKTYFTDFKIERGTVATDWSPAPEDLVYKWQTEGVLPHRYVVRWDKVQNTCTRMYDAAGITTDTTHFAYHGSVDAAYDNPFDKLYPWSHRKLCKADKAKYKELYEAGGDVMGAITKWEGEPGFALGPSVPGMDMVYTPEFWMRQWEDGGYVYIGVADGPIYGWQYVPEMVTGRYLASKDGEGLTSLAGGVPYVDTVSIAQLHAKAKADHLTLDTIQTWDPETVLMVVEYADMNCQSAIGQSVSNLYRHVTTDRPKEAGTASTVILPAAMKDFCIKGAILDFNATDDDRGLLARRVITKTEDAEAGCIKVTFDGGDVTYTTDTRCNIHGLYNAPDEQIGSKSGHIGVNGRSLAYYRGRNCWGNAYHYLLGAYREQYTGHIWVAPDLETADELDALDKSKCIDTGCALPQGASGAQGEGYIKELHLLPDHPMAPFCKTTGGDSTKPVGDYVWWPALNAGNTICLAGADANGGLSVGRFAANWHLASSVAWWSSAASLAFKNPKGGV